MKALVSYRKDRHSPILETFNVAGSGSSHIEKICDRYAASKGDQFGYWKITFHQQNPDIRSIRLEKGVPVIRQAKNHLYKGSPDYNGFQLPASYKSLQHT